MRVLITRPEREAMALATALSQRGHVPVIAPLFRLDILHPPGDFAASLAACQAVLLTSANGARALAEASEQRGRPILAVGDTTATTAEGLGFNAVTSAAGDGAALAELVRQRLDPKAGPLLHVSGVDVALDLGETLRADGFEVRRFALYDAREESTLPDSARAALQARALDAVTFFSPRAASQFAKLVKEAGLADTVRDLTAIAISPAALAPLGDLPFKATVAAARPTRQAVLDEIDRLAEAGVQGQAIMSDTASSSPPPAAPPPVPVRRGLGVVGAFIIGVVAAVLVLAGAAHLAALLARTGAGAVARPGGHPARADAGHRPADRAGRRRHRRQSRGRHRPARAHRPSRRPGKAPARGIGDRGRTAGGDTRSGAGRAAQQGRGAGGPAGGRAARRDVVR